jgi:hypothetical protein
MVLGEIPAQRSREMATSMLPSWLSPARPFRVVCLTLLILHFISLAVLV